MTTTHTRTKALTAAVGAAIATIAAPALLVLGGGTAQATPDISARLPVGIIGDLPTPRECPGCGGFNPQPDPAVYPDFLPALNPEPDETVGTHTGKGIASGIGDGTASPAPELSRRTRKGRHRARKRGGLGAAVTM